MEILEAYDLTGSFRQAAALVGCDHKTAAYWVRLRDEASGTRGGAGTAGDGGGVRDKARGWLIARGARSARMWRTASWSRSAIRDLRGRRGGGWRSPGAGGVRSMAAVPGR